MLVLLPPAQGKPYRICFEHRPEYLYVKVSAESTSFAIAKRYWGEILAMQHRRRYQCVLLEKEIPRSLHPHDVVMLVSELAHSGARNVVIAVVDPNYDAERCAFEEMAGSSRGLQVKMWRSVPEAEAWLRRHWPAQYADAQQNRAA